MKHRETLLSLAVVALLAGVLLWKSSSDPTINDLERLVAKDNLNEAFKLIQNVPFAVDEKNERLIEWVLANHERLNALFLIDLSGRVFLRDRAEGLKWHYVSQMWARYDAERCTDKTAGQGLMFLFGRLAEDVSSYANKHMFDGTEEIPSAIAAAVAWEKDHPSLASPLWICSHGMSAYQATVGNTHLPPEKMVHPKEKWPAIRERQQIGWAKRAKLKMTTITKRPNETPAEQPPESSASGASGETRAAADKEASKETPVMNKDMPGEAKVSLELIRELDHDYGIKRIAWSRDGRYLASTGIFSIGDMVWDAKTGKPVMTAKKKWAAPGGGIGISPDGRYLITSPAIESTTENRLAATLWDLQSRKIVRHLTGPHHGDPLLNDIGYAMFSPEGRFLILAYPQGKKSIGVYDASSWELIRSFGYENVPARSMALSPDARHLALGSFNGIAQVWDYHTGTLVKEFRAQTGSVEAMDYSPDGKFLVTGGNNNQSMADPKTGTIVGLFDNDIVRVWNADDYRMAWSYPGATPGARISSVAYSPDGRYIAVDNMRAAKGKFREFNILDGRSARVLKTVPVPMYIDSLAFDPKGDALAVSGDDTIMIWRIRP